MHPSLPIDPPARRPAGLTAIEVSAALAVVAIVGSIFNAGYFGWRDRQGTEQAATEILTMGARLAAATGTDGQLPDSLDRLFPGARDPWGRPYQYRRVDRPDDRASARTDHAAAPINTRFDLYSLGPDGESQATLADRSSRDDIVWGRDGLYVGTARDF